MTQPGVRNKSRLRTMLTAPRRFACRRGFGVHSPLAFSVLESVVRESCAYYCYPAIDAVARRTGSRARLLRMAFRLAVFMNAGRYECFGPDRESMSAVLGMRGGYSGCGGAEVVSVSEESAEAYAAAHAALENEGAVIITRLSEKSSGCQAFLERLTALRWDGLVISGTHAAILVARKGYLRRTYSVWI